MAQMEVYGPQPRESELYSVADDHENNSEQGLLEMVLQLTSAPEREIRGWHSMQETRLTPCPRSTFYPEAPIPRSGLNMPFFLRMAV